MDSVGDVGLLTTHKRQQVPVQLAPEIEAFVSAPLVTRKDILVLPEPQSLFRVEMDVLPRSELCADVNISEGDESTQSLFVLCGTRFRACVGHW